jgi:signal transduction histidine kinase
VNAHVGRAVLDATRPVDWLLVASLLLLAWFEIWVEPIFQTGMPGPRLPMTLFAAVAVAPLLARRTFPLGALLVMCMGVLGVGIFGEPDQSAFVLALAAMVAAYSVAVHATTRNALVGVAALAVTALVLQLISFDQMRFVDALVSWLFVAAAWMVGREVHRQRQRAGEAAERSALAARTHRLEVAAALAAERTRIARELHDVVAHAISVMGIQASAARRTLAPGQQAQREALLHVEHLGREALVEMQRMLGVLRTGDDEQGASPLPDLGQVPALAADARRTGLPVELNMTGDVDGLPPALQLTAYRIVQEALTNARRHAKASSVDVSIVRCDEHLDVTVADDGVGAPSQPEPGNGLIGMRERVGIHHGSLYAGPRDEPGWVVHARLPLRTLP